MALVLLVTATTSQSCTTYSCVPENAECTADMYTGYTGSSPGVPAGAHYTCENGYFCGANINYVDNGRTPASLCYKVGRIGDHCQNNNQCAHSLVCYNTQFLNDDLQVSQVSTCQNQQFAALGEDCSSDFDCMHGADNLQCSLEGVCVAKLNGNSADYYYFDCQYDIQCDADYFCNNTIETFGNCVPRATVGQPCGRSSGDSAVCMSNLLCDGSIDALTCVVPFSKVEGDKCSHSENLVSAPISSPCNLAAGLTCDGALCSKRTPDTPATSNCSATACTGSEETCVCNSVAGSDPFTGQCISNYGAFGECQAASLAYINCVQEHSCQSDADGAFHQDSCAMNRCKKEYCNSVSKCVSPSPSNCYTTKNPISDFGVCGDLSSSSSVRPFLTLVTMVLIATLL
eukprot:gene15037-17789_t